MWRHQGSADGDKVQQTRPDQGQQQGLRHESTGSTAVGQHGASMAAQARAKLPLGFLTGSNGGPLTCYGAGATHKSLSSVDGDHRSLVLPAAWPASQQLESNNQTLASDAERGTTQCFCRVSCCMHSPRVAQ